MHGRIQNSSKTGLAEGEFTVPNNIDKYNDEIVDLFEVFHESTA